MHPVTFPARISVVDQNHVHHFWADPDQARELIRDCGTEIVYGRKKARALRMTMINGQMPMARRSSPHFVHRHETDQNPRGVWTHKRITEPPLEVLRSCIQKAA
jgi:hypothetical protein